MRSIRSTYVMLLVFLVVGVGYSVIDCRAAAGVWANQSFAWRQGFDAAGTSLWATVMLGRLVIVVFGALILTSEYSTGMIGTSLCAMPRRPVLYAAKSIAFTAVTLAVSLVTSFAAFFVGQALLSSKHINVTLADPKVLRAVLLTAVSVPISDLLAYGLGAIIRNTAGAITAALGMVLLAPVLALALPSGWQRLRWLPGLPGVTQLSSTKAPSQLLFGAWGELAVIVVWAAVAVAVGGWSFQRRDL
jgi:ABC-type transport system involved in multi-copper enzyme maturation permease subunit